MAEPLTLGTFVAGALATTAEAALKGFVGATAKDAYEALKTAIGKGISGKNTTLEDSSLTESAGKSATR